MIILTNIKCNKEGISKYFNTGIKHIEDPLNLYSFPNRKHILWEDLRSVKHTLTHVHFIIWGTGKWSPKSSSVFYSGV